MMNRTWLLSRPFLFHLLGLTLFFSLVHCGSPEKTDPGDPQPCANGRCDDPKCQADCTGRQCGSDGCGSSCGECGSDQMCSDGQCIATNACIPVCDDHQCGSDNCNGGCGQGCPTGGRCDGAGQCEPVPDPYTQPPVLGVDTSHWSVMLSDDDIACFLDNQVTHLIVGMTDPYLGRQQILRGLDAGMTVDAYIYLYWDLDVATQVRETLTAIADLPIRHFWLDVEEENVAGHGAAALADDIAAGLAECAALPCGIYTGWGYWLGHMDNTTRFAHVPLWYAIYDEVSNMDDWDTSSYYKSFGGWIRPQGKQYTNTVRFCGVTLDRDVFYLDPIAADELRPLSPTGLLPQSGAVVSSGPISLSGNPVTDALGYEFEIWHWGGQWFEFTEHHELAGSVLDFAPPYGDTRYQWRMRARNNHGVGHWSEFAILEVGESDPAVSAPPPPPRGLFPEDDIVACTEMVDMACNAWPGVTSYEFNVEYLHDNAWKPYFTFPTANNFKLFSPTVDKTSYRFRVRAKNSNGWGAWSDWASFGYQQICPELP